MKKLIRIFPVFIIVLMSISIIKLNDMQEKQLYKEVQSFDSLGINIPSTTENITDKHINELFDAAIDNNVLLVKTIYNDETNSVDNYITTKDIITLFSDQFEINEYETLKQDAITTYDSNNVNVYYKKDFLNNDRYSFYPTEYMELNNVYKYGTYTLYYQDYEDCNMFFNSAEDILNIPRDELYNEYWGQLKEHTDILFIGMVGAIAFFSLFYFILIIFLFYKESKKIGVLTLLGFNKKDILILMNKKFIFMLFVFGLVLSIGGFVLLPNAKIDLQVSLLIINIVLIVLTVLISYVGLNFIYKYTNLSNILKRQSIVKKITNICLVTKFIVVSFLVLFSISMFPFVQEAKISTNLLKESEELMDYAVFPRLHVENAEYDDSERFLAFYKEVIDQNIDHIYVRFDDYLETDEESINNLENMEKTGTYFRYASVDKNYLDLYNLIYYSEDLTESNIESIDQEFFLLPKSKKTYLSKFKEYISKKYEKYQLNEPVLIFLYDDCSFDTFDCEKGIKNVESPILRVVHKNNPYSYIEKSYGIDVAGTGMNTGLKFNVNNTPDLFNSELKECIKTAGLQNVLLEENFIKYKDYYIDEISNAKKMNSIFLSAICIGLGIYITLIFQTFSLFIEARKNEILVKSILGFSRKDIFFDVIFWNIGVTLLPLIGFLLYSIFSKSLNLTFVVAVLSIFMVLDILLVLLVTHIVKINNVYSMIKGE